MGAQDAVLDVVVEYGPDYGYSIVQRLDTLSSAAVYNALKRLCERDLIERLGMDDGGRKHYRATSKGMDAARLRREVSEAPDRALILRRLEGADMGELPAVLDEYERDILDRLAAAPMIEGVFSVSKMLRERSRLVLGAELRWVSYVREAMEDGPAAD